MAFPYGKPASTHQFSIQPIAEIEAFYRQVHPHWDEPARWLLAHFDNTAVSKAIGRRRPRYLLTVDTALRYADAVWLVSQNPQPEDIDRLWEWHSVSRLFNDRGLMELVERLDLEGALNAAWRATMLLAVHNTDAALKHCPVAYDHIERAARASLLDLVGEHHVRNYREDKARRHRDLQEDRAKQSLEGRVSARGRQEGLANPYGDPEVIAGRRAYMADWKVQIRQARYLAGQSWKPTDNVADESDDGWGMRAAFLSKLHNEPTGDRVDHDWIGRQPDLESWHGYGLLPTVADDESEYEPMDKPSLTFACERLGLTAAERAVVARLNAKRPGTKATELFDLDRYEADSKVLRRMRCKLGATYWRNARVLAKKKAA